MHRRIRYWFIGGAALMLLTSGCFQSAGNAQSFSAADNTGPTFTPIPSLTPFPTQEPDVIVVTATTDPYGVQPQSFSAQDNGLGVAQVPTDNFVQPPLDELQMTATAIVQQATDVAAINMTGTACALGACLPTPTETPLVFPTNAPIPGVDCIHEVRAEDKNLYRISLRYGVTVDAIVAATTPQIFNPNVISIGQRLTIPGCGTTGAVPPATSTPENTTNGGVFVPTPTPFVSGGTGAVAGTTYIVKQGDTLFAISIQTGVPVQSIVDANGIQNINVIQMGDTLVIPGQ